MNVPSSLLRCGGERKNARRNTPNSIGYRTGGEAVEKGQEEGPCHKKKIGGLFALNPSNKEGGKPEGGGKSCARTLFFSNALTKNEKNEQEGSLQLSSRRESGGQELLRGLYATP